jgi:hypothetical protein
LRRCIVPVDGFFEWRAIKGQRAKQPYAIAMKDGAPFGIAGIWENWKEPASGGWIRTFAIITTDANELVASIHADAPDPRFGRLCPVVGRQPQLTQQFLSAITALGCHFGA